MNKVTSVTKTPKNPSIKIGEFGKSYTGIFISIRKLDFILEIKLCFSTFCNHDYWYQKIGEKRYEENIYIHS
tara:strand:- start:281 stop:496 length:216 start_codon:yes stop_codon:yes gene_type:complete